MLKIYLHRGVLSCIQYIHRLYSPQYFSEFYNVFCYADDLILISLSVTGLQTLINTHRDP